MKQLKRFYFLLLISILYGCNNAATVNNNSADSASTIEEKRDDYLKRKEWMSPEDMAIFRKGIPPDYDKLWINANEREQLCRDNLAKLNYPKETIDRIVTYVARNLSAPNRVFYWDYILKNFARFEEEMNTDPEWQKIETEYQAKMKTNLQDSIH